LWASWGGERGLMKRKARIRTKNEVGADEVKRTSKRFAGKKGSQKQILSRRGKRKKRSGRKPRISKQQMVPKTKTIQERWGTAVAEKETSGGGGIRVVAGRGEGRKLWQKRGKRKSDRGWLNRDIDQEKDKVRNLTTKGEEEERLRGREECHRGQEKQDPSGEGNCLRIACSKKRGDKENYFKRKDPTHWRDTIKC